MNVPFVGPAYKGRSPYWDGQDCVNLYLEQDETGGKSPVALLGTPGMVALSDVGQAGQEVRGLAHGEEGELFAVCGSKLSKFDTSGVQTVLGTLDSDTRPVSMAYSGVELLVADGVNGYLYQVSNASFAKISSANFPGAARVDYLDGYFVVAKPDSDYFFLSGLYDGSTWDGLTYAAAQGSPDNIVSLAVSHREVWLLGTRTTEVWYNSGAAAPEFPLDRISGVFLDVGCSARDSVAVMDNTVFWLSDRLQVVRANGYVPQIISTRPLEYLIGQYSRVDDAQAMAWTQSGHAFYALTFPSADVTWVYDAATGAWHRRKSFGMGRWRANCHAYFAGKHLVGDCSTGKIYELSETVFTEDGMPIERVRDTAPISNQGKRMFMSMLQVDFEPGVGTASGQGRDPQAMLQWSDDGGRTWSNEHWRPIGKMGQYQARVIWRRLGSFRNRMFRLKVVDPVKVVVLAAFAEVSAGRS